MASNSYAWFPFFGTLSRRETTRISWFKDSLRDNCEQSQQSFILKKPAGYQLTIPKHGVDYKIENLRIIYHNRHKVLLPKGDKCSKRSDGTNGNRMTFAMLYEISYDSGFFCI